MIVSHQHFIWFATALTVGLALVWLVVDGVRLRRALAAPAATAAERGARGDRIFGSIIGLLVAIIGIVGMLRYHLG